LQKQPTGQNQNQNAKRDEELEPKSSPLWLDRRHVIAAHDAILASPAQKYSSGQGCRSSGRRHKLLKHERKDKERSEDRDRPPRARPHRQQVHQRDSRQQAGDATAYVAVGGPKREIQRAQQPANQHQREQKTDFLEWLG